MIMCAAGIDDFMINIPCVNWPEKSGKYKVIQLCINDEPCIRFPDPIYYSHGDMARQMFDIIYSSDIENLTNDSSLLKGPNHSVRGMGYCLVDVEKKKAKFQGWSLSFPLEISEAHINLMKEKVPEWELVYFPPAR